MAKFKKNTINWQAAVLSFNDGRLQDTLTICNSLVKQNVRDAKAWGLLGAACLKLNKSENALQALMKALKLAPADASIRNNMGICLRNLRRFEEAKDAYQKAIELKSDYSDAWFNLGNINRELCEESLAIKAYQQALAINPNYQAAWNNLGNVYRGQSLWDEAIAAYQKAQALFPDVQTLSNLAFALNATGETKNSLDSLREGIVLQPDNVDLHYNMANALRDQGKTAEAIQYYKQTLVLQPKYHKAMNNLGNLLYAEGDVSEGLEYLREAIAQAPKEAHYQANFSNIAKKLNKNSEAIAALRLAIELKPEYAPYQYNLGNLLRMCQLEDSRSISPAEIEIAYKRAIELDPEFTDAWNNLAGFFSDNNRDEDAITIYQKTVIMEPKNWQLHFNLASRLQSSGDNESARKIFRTGLELQDHSGARIRCETLVPAILGSEEEVVQVRLDLSERIDRLRKRGLIIKDPMLDIASSPMFYLAYHGDCNADLMRSYTSLIREACPDVSYVAPHALELTRKGGKIRIGFASKFFQAHTIGSFFRGILKNLRREDFEVFAFMTPTKQDDVTQWIKNHVDSFEMLPNTLPAARECIAKHQLDILVYTDIGMEPFTYYLAFSRLAAVQCVLYGHPDTTGIPTIDYFLSGGACESDQANSHYTERLVRLDPKSTYTYYYRPLNRSTAKSRIDLGLPENLNLYTCAQTMFKIHPEMDKVFDEILERDPRGQLLLFNDISQRRIALFKQRLKTNMQHYDRIKFLSRMQLPDFLQVLHLSDALLDSFHFCGGNSSFDSFAADAPIVTLPGEFMRGRQTMGLYQRMGFSDLVASDKADYINKALRLGQDPEFRQLMRQQLISQSPLIYEDAGFVRSLEQFFYFVMQNKV